MDTLYGTIGNCSNFYLLGQYVANVRMAVFHCLIMANKAEGGVNHKN